MKPLKLIFQWNVITKVYKVVFSLILDLKFEIFVDCLSGIWTCGYDLHPICSFPHISSISRLYINLPIPTFPFEVFFEYRGRTHFNIGFEPVSLLRHHTHLDWLFEARGEFHIELEKCNFFCVSKICSHRHSFYQWKCLGINWNVLLAWCVSMNFH